MTRLTPYLFFILAALAFVMVALSDDDAWQSQDVSLFNAVLIIGGVFLAAHGLRKVITMVSDRHRTRRK